MMVSNFQTDNNSYLKRLVLGKFNALYIVVASEYEKDYESNKTYLIATFKFAKEIEKPKILELTLEEIAKKFNVNVEQLKIIK